jgi:hypothetical protein
MEHALRMCGGQPAAELNPDVEDFFRRQPPGMPKQRREILPRDELHRVEDLPVRFADVKNATHRRMSDLACEPHFTQNLGAVGVSRRVDELQRNRRVQNQVVGTPHLAHAASPDARHHAIAPREDGASRKGRAGRIGDGAWRLRARRRGDRRRQGGKQAVFPVLGLFQDLCNGHEFTADFSPS